MKKLIVLTLAAACVLPSAWAVQGTIKTEKGQMKGDIVWKGASKKYELTYKRGSTDVSAEFTPAEIEKLDIPKPANFDSCVQNRNTAGLKKIVQDYRMLTWDRPAGNALVNIYISQSKAQDAYDIARKMIDDDQTAAYKGELAPAYWQALLALGKKPQLENCLKKAATDGDRLSSARALVMRGDVIAQADSVAAHRQALVDAYLRVALMYTDPECLPARREALQRAAASFKKIGQESRGEDMKNLAQQLQ